MGVLLCVALLCSTAEAARRKGKAAPKASNKVAPKAAPAKSPAKAPVRKAVRTRAPRVAAAPAPDISYICIEAESGLVLAEQNADQRRPPASMVKMMLMLLVSEGLEKGQWTLDKKITISKEVEATDESQVGLLTGQEFTLSQLMNAVAVCSANDAALAVAEGLWGSEAAYVQTMNKRAQELGMKDSLFQSPHGLPPAPGKLPDETTARDMAILAQQCTKHPSIMQWVGQQELTFSPHTGTRFNTNKLLWTLPGCDGMKTGYTRAAGFCLTATAMRDGVRLITVVMGFQDKSMRNNTAQTLLEANFGGVTRQLVVAKGQQMNVPVQVMNCAKPTVQLVSASDVYVTLPKSMVDKVEVVPQQPEIIQAPATAGAVMGEVQVKFEGHVVARAPLALTENLDAAGWKWKMQESVRHTGQWLRRSKQVEQTG
jgi:D-alanyl-D-alanine carboxypeptidase (penicillin-binding protein 5/6)